MTFRLASCGEDVKLWEGNSTSLICQHQYSPHVGSVNGISWRCDGQYLASCSAKGDTVVLAHASRKPEDFKTVEVPVIGEQQCLQFSRSTTRYLITGGTNGEISVWDLKTNKRNRVYTNHTAAVTKVMFNWNDTYILSGSAKGDVILHHIQTGNASSPMRSPKVQAIRDLRFSIAQRILFSTASDDGAVTLWDSNTRHMKHQFKNSHQAPAMGLAFPPYNNLLMASVGLDKKLVLYDLSSKKIVKTVTSEQPLTAIDFHQDGITVAVGTIRGQINIYDLRQTQGLVNSISAHKSSVQSILFQTEKNRSATTRSVGRSASTSPKRFLSAGSSIDTQSAALARVVPVVNGTTIVGQNQKALEVSASGDRDKNSSNVTCSSTSSISDDVFSPLREESPDTRRQPIGSSPIAKPPAVLGDRPAVTGLANVDATQSGLLFDNITVRRSGASSGTKRRSSSSSPRAIRQLHADQSFGHSSSFVDATGTLPSFKSSMVNAAGSHSAEEASTSSPLKERHSSLQSRAETHTATPTAYTSHASSDEILQSEPKPTTLVASSEDDELENSTSCTNVFSVNSNDGHNPSLLSLASCSSKTIGSCAETSAAGASGSHPGAASITSDNQVELIRKIVEESLEDLQDSFHQEIMSLQTEMLRHFQIQQAEIEALFQRYSLNNALMEEVRLLREENKRLRSKF